MKPSEGRLPGSCQLFQVCDRRIGPATFRTTFNEQPLRRIAPPRVGMTKMIDQLGARSATQVGLKRRQSAFGSDSINPAALFPRAQVEFTPDLFRNVVGMFNHIPLHVAQVESAVRTRSEEH